MKRIQHLFTNTFNVLTTFSVDTKYSVFRSTALVFFFLLTTVWFANAQCFVTYKVAKTPTGEFQVSMIPNTFLNPNTSPPENLVSDMKISLKVNTGGFAVSDFNQADYILTGSGSTVNWNQTSFTNLNNSGSDYLCFSLGDATSTMEFTAGKPVYLFSFKNGGACTSGPVELVDNNTSPNANIIQQLTVGGVDLTDDDICIDDAGVTDCTETCKVDYEIKKRSDGRFQIDLIPSVTYTGVDNYVTDMRIVAKFHKGTFTVSNIVDLVHAFPQWDVTLYPTPVENPDYDYVAFSLKNASVDYTFTSGIPIPLFIFENSGECSSAVVTLLDESDPFYNSSATHQHELIVAGFKSPNIPICVTGSGAQDCSTNCYFACNDEVQISLGINCSAEILPDLIAKSIDATCPGGTKTVEVRALDNTLLPTSPMMNESHVNQTFNVKVIDDFTGNSCWGRIVVEDKTGPILNCATYANNTNITTVDCSENLDPSNALLGYPQVTNNCLGEIPNLTYEDAINTSLCTGSYTAVVTRTWTATGNNAYGSAGTCTQQIYIRRLPMDDIVFPVDRDGIDAPVLACVGTAIDPSITGAPTLYGKPIYPSFDGLCEIDVGYSDQIDPTCGGSNQIHRIWTAVNNCTNEFKTYIQTIKLVDEQAPTITCISDTLRFSTNQHDCAATVSLPTIIATDVCSAVSVQMVTPNGIVNSNGGILNGLQQGLHKIEYIATDACGNKAACIVHVEVRDVDGPTAVCNNSQVAIGPSGWVDVNANTFDDGSYDDCCDAVTFQVKRVDQITTDFADFVSFSCEDLGKNVDIILQVIDCFGNTSQCTASILVINDNSTNIQCPANLTIACQTDYADLNIFGAPTLMDNCGQPNFQVQNNFDIDSCGAGIITRTFSIIDGGVTTGTCTQEITIENESTFDENNIVWPHDYLSLACGSESLLPSDLPYGFNQPTYEVNSTCNNIFVKYTDSNFDDEIAANGCYEIHRLWEVIDWCNYNVDQPNAGGRFVYTQIISIVNNVAPTIACPADVTINLGDNECTTFVNIIGSATDDCTPGNLLRYTYTIDLQNDGTEDLSGTTGIASGNYGPGTHKVSFTVADDCGNQDACSYLITIVDNTLPVARCFFPDLVIIPKSGDFAAVPAPEIIGQSSTDNCTAYENLTLKVSPTFFTCNEIGSNPITLTVTDESGNVSSCSGRINVRDPNNLCPKNKSAINISGNVTNEDGVVLEQVLVSINDKGGQSSMASSMTDEYGVFQLDSIPTGKDYTIFPERNYDHLNGISTYDLVVLNRHILGLQFINSPYKLIAADVNRSGTITAYDIVILRKLILRLINDFPNNTSWRFIKRDFTFDDPTNPLQEYFPEVYTIEKAPGKDMNIGGFIAVKVGDLNTSASTTNNISRGESRQASKHWNVSVAATKATAGTTVEIPVTATHMEQILGYQFALHIDQDDLEVIEIIPGDLPNMTSSNFAWVANKGLLSTSWNQTNAERIDDNTTLFTIKAKMLTNRDISTVIQLQEDYLPSEVYMDRTGSELPSLLKVQLNTPTKTFQLYQNTPNPFKHSTTIGFELNKAQGTTLRIINMNGQVVQTYQAAYPAGYHEINIQHQDLPAKGMYYYQLETVHATETKKMLVIK